MRYHDARGRTVAAAGAPCSLRFFFSLILLNNILQLTVRSGTRFFFLPRRIHQRKNNIVN